MCLDWSQLMTRDSQWEFSLRPSDVSRIYVGKEPTDNPQLLERADKLGKWLTNFPRFPFKPLRCFVQCFSRTSGRCSLLCSKKFLLEPKLSFPNEESPLLFVKKVPLISLAAVSLSTWLPLCLVITERKLITIFFFSDQLKLSAVRGYWGWLSCTCLCGTYSCHWIEFNLESVFASAPPPWE